MLRANRITPAGGWSRNRAASSGEEGRAGDADDGGVHHLRHFQTRLPGAVSLQGTQRQSNPSQSSGKGLRAGSQRVAAGPTRAAARCGASVSSAPSIRASAAGSELNTTARPPLPLRTTRPVLPAAQTIDSPVASLPPCHGRERCAPRCVTVSGDWDCTATGTRQVDLERPPGCGRRAAVRRGAAARHSKHGHFDHSPRCAQRCPGAIRVGSAACRPDHRRPRRSRVSAPPAPAGEVLLLPERRRVLELLPAPQHPGEHLRRRSRRRRNPSTSPAA